MLPSCPIAWFRAPVSWLCGAVLAACALPPAAAQGAGTAAPPVGAVVQTPELRAELVVHAPEGLAPGRPMWLGLALQHSPRWHTYWLNPGDSGLPTRLNWTLPQGVEAGPIAWPLPERQRFGPLVNYGYDGEQLLPVALTLPAGWRADTRPVRLRADWLVCAEVCLPQSGEFALEVPAPGPQTARAAAFTQALAAVPRAAAGLDAQARVDGPAVVVDVAGLPEALRGKPLQLFAEQPGVIDHAATPTLQWQGDRLRLRQALSPQRSESPDSLALVLAADGTAGAVRLAAPVVGGWPAPGSTGGAA
ncbi:MAG: protein-disulfide reductase, partial [Burkholderiales bacterium]|nr:protein-disulfide reductase [Burkholderiales bacterium]